MKKLIGFSFIIALAGGISCKPDVTVNPTTTIIVADTVMVDPDILKFAKFMTATWRCTRTSFTTTNTDWIYSDSVDCDKEKQFAFLKGMKITGTNHYDILKVENTYACSSDSATTYFHLEKIACCGFTITEKDDLNQVIRILDFVMPDGQSLWNDILLSEKGLLGTTMYIRTYDPTTFDLSNAGSLVKLPSIYMVVIEKNF